MADKKAKGSAITVIVFGLTLLNFWAIGVILSFILSRYLFNPNSKAPISKR